ncbi:BrnA antitoxin family protein [Sphingomonas morindae]|uniref:BrnA antitoxin family protein n=1 Tax=Sphingomonas morindae TaxID=1541170 RepID=A0ABY4XAH1_9SPHN|nr:BrnA antitoxin family protein [Sphingomonas morindae]USI73967.1 BrnA antitoxin family protein [Sphingomonas morindae]
MASEKPPVFDDDNPEWTEEDFARSRPAAELPEPILAAFPKTAKPIGRPPGSDKERITIRIDKDTLARFRATGPGWQGRINAALRKISV